MMKQQQKKKNHPKRKIKSPPEKFWFSQSPREQRRQPETSGVYDASVEQALFPLTRMMELLSYCISHQPGSSWSTKSSRDPGSRPNRAFKGKSQHLKMSRERDRQPGQFLKNRSDMIPSTSFRQQFSCCIFVLIQAFEMCSRANPCSALQ